jgi:hypothetical protein
MSRLAGKRRPLRTPAIALALLTALSVLSPPVSGPETGDGSRLRLAAAPSDPTEPLDIATVPAVAGFPVTLDGVTVRTDAEGRAHFPETGQGDLAARIALSEAVLPVDGQQVRVSADRFYPSSTAPALGLNLSYLVRFRYSDQKGRPIDAASVGTVTLKSITGEVVELGAQESVWLHGSRVIKLASGLTVKDLRWSVQRVEYHGTNVVNASQQRFAPATRQDMSIELLFYELGVHTRDALFGFASGRAVELTFPDGKVHQFPLDGDGRADLPLLPRGDYSLTLLGNGPRLPQPVSVSRDLQLELDFHSWLDIATVLGGIIAFALALAVVGRFRRRRDLDSPGFVRAPRRPRRDRPEDQVDDPLGEPPVDPPPAEPSPDLAPSPEATGR